MRLFGDRNIGQMSDPRESLDELRREIDRIDDQMQDLIIRRAEMAQRVRLVKGDGPAFRPSREAQLLRRLMQRHRGNFPGAAVARMWREMVAAMLGLQGKLTVAVADGAKNPGVWDLARDHFGSHSALSELATSAQVVRAVADGDALVGVLPLPREDEPEPWWPGLAAVGRDNGQPRIVARLPFVAAGNARSEKPEALVLARVEPEPTGKDRTLLVIETKGDMSRARLVEVLSRVGLVPSLIIGVPAPGDRESRLTMIETEGFVAPDDARLASLGAEARPITRVTAIGAYAEPIAIA